MYLVDCKVPEEYLAQIDRLVELGLYTTRSEVIRLAIWDFLQSNSKPLFLQALLKEPHRSQEFLDLFASIAVHEDRQYLEEQFEPSHPLMDLLNQKFSIHLDQHLKIIL